MKPGSAKLAVVFGVGTAVVGTTVKEILDGQSGPSFYVPLAGALVAIPLLIASDFQPDIAGGMGVLILVAAWVYSGQAIMKAVGNATGRTVITPSTTINDTIANSGSDNKIAPKGTFKAI